MEEEFLKYKVENVGGKIHNELWVPSEGLDRFNRTIKGDIEIISVCVGKDFKKVSNPLVKKIMDNLQGIQ